MTFPSQETSTDIAHSCSNKYGGKILCYYCMYVRNISIECTVTVPYVMKKRENYWWYIVTWYTQKMDRHVRVPVLSYRCSSAIDNKITAGAVTGNSRFFSSVPRRGHTEKRLTLEHCQ